MQWVQYFQEMWQLAREGNAQGIWFWAGVYSLLLCAYSMVFQIRTRYWPATEGELIDYGIRKFAAITDPVKSDQEYASYSRYKYVVDGKQYEGKRLSPWLFIVTHNVRFILRKQMAAIHHLPDGRVEVFYNPGDPGKSYLIVATRRGIFVTFLFGLLPLLLFYLRFYT